MCQNLWTMHVFDGKKLNFHFLISLFSHIARRSVLHPREVSMRSRPFWLSASFLLLFLGFFFSLCDSCVFFFWVVFWVAGYGPLRDGIAKTHEQSSPNLRRASRTKIIGRDTSIYTLTQTDSNFAAAPIENNCASRNFANNFDSLIELFFQTTEPPPRQKLLRSV